MIYLDVIGKARTGFKSVRRVGIILRYHFLRMVFWCALAAFCRERLGKALILAYGSSLEEA